MLTSFWRLSALVVFLLVRSTLAWSATPYCPGGGVRTTQFTGLITLGSNYGGLPISHPVLMYPCDEMWVELEAQEGHPTSTRHINVRMLNEWGGVLVNEGWNFDGTLSRELPHEQYGRPHPGTRSPNNNIVSLQVKSNDANALYPVTYAVRIHVQSRPGFNEGGLTFKDSYGPLNSGASLKFTLAGQPATPIPKPIYYRVSLNPGGTLQLTGTLTNKIWSAGGNLGVNIYNADEAPMGQILFKPYPANSIVSAVSSVFTNPTSQVQDFHIRGLHGGATLYAADLVMTANTYQPLCSCWPPFNGTNPGWTGIRKVKIWQGGSTGFDASDTADIMQGLDEWNKKLLSLGIDIQFEVAGEMEPYDIQMFVTSSVKSGADWLESVTQPSMGYGSLRFSPTAVNQGKANFVWHSTLHEFGHALDFSHFTLPDPLCAARDSIMWPTVSERGPFPGLTCADTQANDYYR